MSPSLFYGNDRRITDLVNTTALWFCPLPNPDYMYYDGDDHIYNNASVTNPFHYDLNRNWPCPCMKGNHKYYGLYSKQLSEIAALMKLDTTIGFNLHTFFAAGAEAVVWPYGADSTKKVCDEEWYVWAAHRYVNQAHKDCGNNGYMASCGGDGVGNVYKELFECHGTRLDYCSRFAQIKGSCVYISIIKQPPENCLANYWSWNKEALFQYYELLHTGIQGIVIDAATKKPIYKVNIKTGNHDFDSADVYTDSAGFYVRYIERGSYSLTFSHPEYRDTTISGITVNSHDEKRILNVELDHQTGITSSPKMTIRDFSIIQTNNGLIVLFHKRIGKAIDVSLYNTKGLLVSAFKNFRPESSVCSLQWDTQRCGSGMYVLKIKSSDAAVSQHFALVLLKNCGKAALY